MDANGNALRFSVPADRLTVGAYGRGAIDFTGTLPVRCAAVTPSKASALARGGPLEFSGPLVILADGSFHGRQRLRDGSVNEVRGRFVAPDRAEGTWRWRYSPAVDGSRCDSGRISWRAAPRTIEPSGGGQPPLPPRGHANVITPVAPVTPVPPPVDSTPVAWKGVAIGDVAHFWGGYRAGMDSDFADMNAGDISWARVDLYYSSTPDPNFDAAVQIAHAHHVNLVVTVKKGPPENDLGTAADRAAYRTWLAQMVNRYKYYVKYWQIQNEPNLHYEWNIDDSSGSDQTQYVASVNRYVTLLKDAYETIKANDPTATVLFGGLSEWTVERYMDVLTTTDAYRYFDVMSFHPYGWDPNRVLSRFNSFKSKMNASSRYAAKPIWVTEFGFNSSWTNRSGYVTSEQQKADYLVQTVRLLRAAGAGLPIFWYTLHEHNTETGFGLTVKDKYGSLVPEYLPAFFAYRDLSL
jgi:Glycosyl hydrolase catalytic core